MDSYKALLFLLFGFVALSNALEVERIKGGDLAVPGQFKYQVSLQVGGGHVCGGCILGDLWVLTGAHCVLEPSVVNRPMKVVAGVQDVADQGPLRVEVNVIHAYLPKIYYSNVAGGPVLGDIAILKLKQSLNIGSNKHLEKIGLPHPSMTFANQMAQISGFGVQNMKIGYDPSTGVKTELGGQSDGKLRYANAKVISNQQCSMWLYLNGTPESLLCAQVVQRWQNNPEGVCSGDSGGPLVVGNVVVGVSSRSPFGCEENYSPATYTRVSSYTDSMMKIFAGQIPSSYHDITLPLTE